MLYRHLRGGSFDAWVKKLLKTHSRCCRERRTLTFVDRRSLIQVPLWNYDIDLASLICSWFRRFLTESSGLILKNSMTWWREWKSWLWMLDWQLLYSHMMWNRIDMILSYSMMCSRAYLLKITATRVKLRCTLRGAEKASVIINLVWNRVCHMRGVAAYPSSIIRVSFRIRNICSSIISSRSDIMLWNHALWSLVTFIDFPANYFGCRSFGNQSLLSHLLSGNIRRIYYLRRLWLCCNIVPFLVRLNDFVRTCGTHVAIVSFGTIAHLIIVAMRRCRLWSVRSLTYICRHSRWCRHCMLWC